MLLANDRFISELEVFNMSDRLKNKVAIVTGGSSGIGLAIVKRFKEEGAKVVIGDLQEPKDPELKQALDEGDQALFCKLDVANEDSWTAIINTTLQKYQKLNIIVNNAGIGLTTDVEHSQFDDWRKLMSINCDGVFLGVKHGIIAMKDNGEQNSIINMSSIEGFVGNPDYASYNASKGAVRLLTKSAALYTARQDYPVRVNSIHPGFVNTPILDEKQKPAIAAQMPMKRLADPKEIANMALFLASDEASYCTGAEYLVDGGFTAE